MSGRPGRLQREGDTAGALAEAVPPCRFSPDGGNQGKSDRAGNCERQRALAYCWHGSWLDDDIAGDDADGPG